jgi:hypothetical protein
VESPVARLEVEDPVERDGRIRLVGRLMPPKGAPREAWFEFDMPDGWMPPRRSRPFALAFLPLAMRRGWRLAGEDALDGETVSNLNQWQAVFSHWFPWSLEQIQLCFPRAAEPRPRLAGPVLAFSGGLDSTEVLVRRRLEPRDGRPPMAAGVLIQGFDIPLAAESGFARRWEAASAVLSRFGARGLRLRTNLRTLARRPYLDWAREVHGIWLAAAMSCLEPWYGELVLASSDINRRLTLPWASNPITDRFLGGATSRVVNEGGEHSRLEKILFLADAGVLDGLRVCYERPETGHNCGRCRKCLFLQLGLESLGLGADGLFAAPPDRGFRRRFRTSVSYFRDDLMEMAEAAETRGCTDLAEELRGMAGRSPWLGARDALRGWWRRVR